MSNHNQFLSLQYAVTYENDGPSLCPLTRPPSRDTLHQRLQLLRCLYSCSGCFPLERFAGQNLHPLESAAFSRRKPESVVSA
ncbi:protein of unknown function [Burkholderia multivorans]